MTRRRRRRSSGATIVESALTLTAFLMLVFGIIDFGRMIWAYSTVAHASREGVRFAIVHGAQSAVPATATSIADVVRGQMLALDPAKTQVSVQWIAVAPLPAAGVGSNRPGDQVSVQTTYFYSPILPYIPVGTLPLKSSSRMTIYH